MAELPGSKMGRGLEGYGKPCWSSWSCLGRKNAWLSITSTSWLLLWEKRGRRELAESSGVAEPPLPAQGSAGAPLAAGPWAAWPQTAPTGATFLCFLGLD